VRDGVRCWNSTSACARSAAVRRSQLGFEEDILHPGAVEVGLQPVVLLVHVAQQNVVLQEPERPAAHTFKHARERRYGRYRPHPDHAHVLIVAHLDRHQHELRKNHQQ
jgi:hypothetical protein